MKKYISAQSITVISFTLAIIGCVNDIFFYTQNIDVFTIKHMLNPLNLDWAFGQDPFFSTNGHNYVNAIFDILLLLGSIVRAASKNQESRLIRFVFAIIFFSKILSFVQSLFFFLFVRSIFLAETKSLLIDIPFYAFNVFWIYLSYNILQYFNHVKELQTNSHEEDGTVKSYFIYATIGQRIIDPLIDTFMTMVLFSPMITLLAFKHPGIAIDFRFVGGVVPAVIILRIFYYLFYETVLGVTPAKLLNETRVVDYIGNKASFKQILIRTLSRLVPLEAFSFFAEDGWHDKWSQTMVVKEKNIKE